MSYSLKQALLKGSALDTAIAPPRERPKYTATLTQEQMKACLADDQAKTWEAMKVLLQSMGIPVDGLSQGIVSASEGADGSLTVVLS